MLKTQICVTRPQCVKKIYCTDSTCSMFKEGYRIVPIISLNQYLQHDTSKTGVNVNTSANNRSEKFLKKKTTATPGKLIIAAYASFMFIFAVHVCKLG